MKEGTEGEKKEIKPDKMKEEGNENTLILN